MTIFGKPLSAYIAFAKVFLVLILAAGVIRLTLSLGGVPNSTTRWFTMTGLAWIGLIYYSIRVHTSGFGSYRQLLVICVLQDWIAQAIAITGIVIAMSTGTDNVFSSPEFAFGSDGKTWLHLGAHLVIGTTVGALLPWAIGSAILAVTRNRKRTNRYPASSASMERS
jgi:hypothetical protein